MRAMLKRTLAAVVNRALSRFDVELVRHSNVQALRDAFERYPKPQSANGSEAGVRDEIARRRGRIDELRSAYAKVPMEHSVWTRDLVEADVPLDRFRDDSAYVWQNRDHNREVNYVVDTLYLRTLDKLGLLGRLHEDGRFGALTVDVGGRLVSRDLLDSVSELLFLDEHVGLEGRELSILDIGAGYGRLAHRAVTAFPKLHYVCTDAIPESTFLCEYYLEHRGLADRTTVVPLHQIESFLGRRSIDLAVNVQSFTECTLKSITFWLDLVAKRHVPYVFLVPGNTAGREDQLLSREADASRKSYLGELEQRGYRLKLRRPKYLEPCVVPYGVSPVDYYLFERAR
jgi:hypothetical protein